MIKGPVVLAVSVAKGLIGLQITLTRTLKMKSPSHSRRRRRLDRIRSATHMRRPTPRVLAMAPEAWGLRLILCSRATNSTLCAASGCTVPQSSTKKFTFHKRQIICHCMIVPLLYFRTFFLYIILKCPSYQTPTLLIASVCFHCAPHHHPFIHHAVTP